MASEKRIEKAASIDAAIDFEDLQFKVRRFHGGTAYGQSKLANVLFTLGLTWVMWAVMDDY